MPQTLSSGPPSSAAAALGRHGRQAGPEVLAQADRDVCSWVPGTDDSGEGEGDGQRAGLRRGAARGAGGQAPEGAGVRNGEAADPGLTATPRPARKPRSTRSIRAQPGTRPGRRKRSGARKCTPETRGLLLGTDSGLVTGSRSAPSSRERREGLRSVQGPLPRNHGNSAAARAAGSGADGRAGQQVRPPGGARRAQARDLACSPSPLGT